MSPPHVPGAPWDRHGDAEVAAVLAGGGLCCARAEAPPPVGVSAARDDAHAPDPASWVRPAGVRFALAAAPSVEGPWLVLRGVLAHDGASPAEVWLTDAGTACFHATLVGEDVVRRPAPPRAADGSQPPPVLHPAVRRHELAPGARWPFAVRVALAAWDLRPGAAVRAHWWFTFAGDPEQGEVAVTLPA